MGFLETEKRRIKAENILLNYCCNSLFHVSHIQTFPHTIPKIANKVNFNKFTKKRSRRSLPKCFETMCFWLRSHGMQSLAKISYSLGSTHILYEIPKLDLLHMWIKRKYLETYSMVLILCELHELHYYTQLFLR